MAKKPREEVSTDGWKDTYGDMVTLLLCFFVLLYSMSSVNSEKWERFVQAFNPGDDTNQVVITPGMEQGDHTVAGDTPDDSSNPDPTDEYPSSFDELYQALKDYVEANNMQDSVEIEGQDGVVYIRYQNSLFFRPNKAELLPEAIPNLEFLGTSLKKLEDSLWLVSISGHTAHAPGAGTAGVSDWLLSAERAGQVAIYLEEHAGLNSLLLRPIGFGDNYPIESNDTSAGQARNRRVEMVIISKDSAIAKNEAVANAVSGLFDHESFVQAPEPDDLKDLLDPSRMGEGVLDESGGQDAGSAPQDAGTGTQGAASGPQEGEPLNTGD